MKKINLEMMTCPNCDVSGDIIVVTTIAKEVRGLTPDGTVIVDDVIREQEDYIACASCGVVLKINEFGYLDVEDEQATQS
ncbi:MAG: hypothetical protein Q8M92_06465 [Candidatus Subteraquimicrobiales bacterium]|nr:hypothetical protein [Candidatus Subteraquimicrobiales bacterium]